MSTKGKPPPPKPATPTPTPRVLRHKHMESRAQTLREVGLVYPAYAQNRFVTELVSSLKAAAPPDRERVLTDALARLYSPRNLAAMVVSRYSTIPIARPFHRQIEGAIAAFFLGHPETAVAALVPTVEGMIRRFAGGGVGKHDVKKALCATLDALIAAEDRRGDQAAVERADMLRVFCNFFEFEFWSDAAGPSRAHGLNRNGIVHGVYADDEFGTVLNFFRLIALIDLLAFIGTFATSGISVLAPDTTPASDVLAAFWLAGRRVAAARPRR